MHIQPKPFSIGLTFPIISHGHCILYILKIVCNEFHDPKHKHLTHHPIKMIISAYSIECLMLHRQLFERFISLLCCILDNLFV